MGTNITNWEQLTGAMYMGADSNMPFIWFIVALIAFTIPLIIGFIRDKKVNTQ